MTTIILKGLLNYLWRYDTINGQWAWKSGSNVINQLGVYGTRGISGALNMPGARLAAITWVDSSGTFWLFGGTGYDSMNMTGKTVEILCCSRF